MPPFIPDVFFNLKRLNIVKIFFPEFNNSGIFSLPTC